MKKIPVIVLLVLLCAVPCFAKDSFFATVNINLAGGVGGVSGDVIKEEKDSTSMTVTYSDGETKTGHPSHNMLNFGVWADIMPFDPILNKKKTTGLNFGLRGRLGYYYILQSIEIGGGEYQTKSYSSKHMTFKSAMIGPVVRWAPYLSKKSGVTSSKFVVTVFAQGGPIFGGKMSPYPIAQENGYAPSMESDVSGIRMELGAGIEFSGGTLAHVGINTYYARNSIKMSPNYYENASSRTTINEFDFELYAGLSF
jgi:hypothetical protein